AWGSVSPARWAAPRAWRRWLRPEDQRPPRTERPRASPRASADVQIRIGPNGASNPSADVTRAMATLSHVPACLSGGRTGRQEVGQAVAGGISPEPRGINRVGISIV